MSTTLEEAKTCPRCGKYGQQSNVKKLSSGGKVFTFVCRTEGCRWENTGWLVQVNADGSIPVRRPGDREFVSDPYKLALGKRMIENIEDDVVRRDSK